MKILRLPLLIAASVLLLFSPFVVAPSASAFSPGSGTPDMMLFGATIPAGVNGCPGTVSMTGRVMSMDICVMGIAQGANLPSGTQYMGNERLSMVLTPTSTPGVYSVLGTNHGQITLSNQYGSMFSSISGVFKGTMTFDANGHIASYNFARGGVVHIQGGTGVYAQAHGNGQYSGTSVMSTSPTFFDQDITQVYIKN